MFRRQQRHRPAEAQSRVSSSHATPSFRGKTARQTPDFYAKSPFSGRYMHTSIKSRKSLKTNDLCIFWPRQNRPLKLPSLHKISSPSPCRRNPSAGHEPPHARQRTRQSLSRATRPNFGYNGPQSFDTPFGAKPSDAVANPHQGFEV